MDYSIRTRNLGRHFGSHEALRKVDLRVPRGSIFGFLGPNGAGKSTTIRILLGLLRPNAGQARVLGGDLRRDTRLRSRVGAVVEDPSVYPHLTARQNLELTRKLRGVRSERPREVLEQVGLSQAADRRAGGFSTGMRQRLALALALLADPELLILDEPTSGLDPAGIQEMRELIRDAATREGRTVFLSSHQLSEVQAVASHVAILDAGTLRFQGTIDDLDRLYRDASRIAVETPRPDLVAARLATRGWEVGAVATDTIEIVDSGDDAPARIAAALLEEEVSFHGLTRVKPSLEDLFFHVLGGRDEAS